MTARKFTRENIFARRSRFFSSFLLHRRLFFSVFVVLVGGVDAFDGERFHICVFLCRLFLSAAAFFAHVR